MGLDTTHGCWHGGYGWFMKFRTELARYAGITLECMMGYVFRGLGNKGEVYCPLWTKHKTQKYSDIGTKTEFKHIPFPPEEIEPLTTLLSHSDCDGKIKWFKCKPLAERLEELVWLMNEDIWKCMEEGLIDEKNRIQELRKLTKKWIKGLWKAYNAKENVEFD